MAKKTKTILVPAGDMVLVKDSARKTEMDGIELPGNMRQQEMVYGTVCLIGPFVTVGTSQGDIVCYGPYAGKTVLVEGAEFRLLREGQIEAYIRTIEDDRPEQEGADGEAAGD